MGWKGRMWIGVALILVLSSPLWAGGEKEKEGEAVGAEEQVTAPMKKATPQVSAEEMTVWATVSDYGRDTGKDIPDYGEAPMLTRMVSAGELPPVDERLPKEPLVVDVVSQIGRYGGSLDGVSPSKAAWNDIVLSFLLDDALLLSNDTGEILPGWAEAYEISEDMREITLFFREGMKWSDGQLFTVDDVLFWWEDDMTNPEVTAAVWSAWKSGGEQLTFRKVDDLTLKIIAKDPYPALVFNLAQYSSHQARMFHPKHYLKKWHIEYNEDADKLARDEDFDSWSKAFNYHKQFEPFPNDNDLPVTAAWRMTEMGTTQAIYERNPYYWKVDTQGNQLPYIDELVANLVSNVEAINLNTISGNFDYACLELSLKNYPVYKENEQQGGYRVLNWSSTDGSVATFSFNLNHSDEGLRKLFGDVRWRQAMSLAIDRDAINETIYFGLAVPRQTTVLPECSFFKESWARAYADYDPDRANQLLDELGLTERDSEGFRLRPDGTPLSIVVNVHDINVYLPISEMVAEYWNNVGVKTTIREVTWELFFTKREALDFDCDVWHLGLAMEGSLYSNPERFSPMLGENSVAPAWGTWFSTDGADGVEPPEHIKELRRWLDEWQMLPQNDPEYVPTARKIYDSYAENLWTIGTVGMPRVPAVVSTSLENVPLEGYHGNDNGFARTFQPWQWFFAE